MKPLISNKLTAILIAVVLAGVSISVATFGALSYTKAFSSNGTIAVATSVSIGVYWDSACTNATTSFNWGTLSPGGSQYYTVYIRNEGNVAEILSLSTNSWSPSNANTYITLSWNAPSSAVAAGSVTAVTLTLSVSSGITGITSFSYVTVITGTQ